MKETVKEIANGAEAANGLPSELAAFYGEWAQRIEAAYEDLLSKYRTKCAKDGLKPNPNYCVDGTCVMGEGIYFEYRGTKYHVLAPTRYQGSLPAEETEEWVGEEAKRLKMSGYRWDYGIMD